MKTGAYTRFHELSHGFDHETDFISKIGGSKPGEIRDEMLELTLKTRVADNIGLTGKQVENLSWEEVMKLTSKKHYNYLRSGREIIAHLGGMIATDPATVKAIAPKAFEAFMKNLENLPAFKQIAGEEFLQEQGFENMNDFFMKVKATGANRGITGKLADDAGISDTRAIDYYIPSKFEDKIKPTDVKASSRIKSPQLGFKKKFEGVDNDKLIRDPFEAYSRQHVEVVNSRIQNEAARATIRNFGKPLHALTKKEAEQMGFVRWTRGGVVKEGQDRIEGWLPKEVADELNELLDPSLKPIDQLAKAIGFDYVTGLFKGYVTSLFPAFHARNMLSNQFQNMLKIGVDILNPALQKNALDIVRGKNLDKVITTKAGTKITLREIRNKIKKESDILDEGAFGRTEQFLEKGKAAIAGTKQKGRFNPLSRENIALQKGRAFGTGAEQQAKLVSVLSAVVEGKPVRDGVKQAEEALFNYAKLAPFERSVMRRLIPFYTFMRKNAEYQLRMLASNPGKIAAEFKGIKGAGEAIGEPMTEDDIEGLPAYVLESLGIKGADSLKNQYGQSTFITGFGLPIEEFMANFSGEKGIVTNVIQNMLARLNPVVKFPSERALDKDFFRNRPISEIRNAQDLKFFLDALPEPVANKIKKSINWVELKDQPVYANGEKVGTTTKYRANPFALHFMRNLFTSRIQGTIGFLSAEDQSNFAKITRFFTGVRGWSIDQEQQKFYNEWNREKELKDFLVKMGLLKKFESVYEPKN